MRVLITGIGGFVGQHLLRHLTSAQPNAELHGVVLRPEDGAHLAAVCHAVDLAAEDQVHALIARLRPARIYHLAAQASPRQSFTAPWDTLANNIRGQLNLILACLAADVRPRMLVVSSAEIYGPGDGSAITEDAPLCPSSPYGVSKVAQDLLGLQYHLSHDLPLMRARPFNHFGPGQREGFVAPDFAMQVARIEAGLQAPVLEVGNLAARRDFTDVRDIVRAYHLLLEQGEPGTAYNIASGTAHSVQEILDTLISFSRASITVRADPARFLPVDVPVRLGSAERLRAATGWQPQIPFEQTLRDLLDECRQRVESRP
jgi:GDP-4-dehydro-6-deoxy-D-mannose reductase